MRASEGMRAPLASSHQRNTCACRAGDRSRHARSESWRRPGPAPARRNPRAPLRPGSTRPRPWRACRATMPRQPGQRVQRRRQQLAQRRAGVMGIGIGRVLHRAPAGGRLEGGAGSQDVIAVLVQPGPQVVHLVTARQRRHGGHARQPGAAQQAQQHGLGLIAPVMRQQHQRRAVFAGQPGQRAVAHRAPPPRCPCRRLRPRSRAPRAPAGPAAGPAPASVHSRHRRRPASRDARGTAAGRCPAPGRWRPHAAPAWPNRRRR